jgi:hypothetical protein
MTAESSNMANRQMALTNGVMTNGPHGEFRTQA